MLEHLAVIIATVLHQTLGLNRKTNGLLRLMTAILVVHIVSCCCSFVVVFYSISAKRAISIHESLHCIEYFTDLCVYFVRLDFCY